MGPQDGVDLVVRVAHVLAHEHGRDDVHFALLGFGDALDDLRELARALQVTKRVEFVGRADDAMVQRWLSTADVGIVPDPRTPFNDVSSMNKTVEYMAFSLPLVAFDLPETMSTANGAGVYVTESGPEAFARVLLDLLDDEERRLAMGRTGREKFERELAWHHQAARYVAAFDAVTGRTA
jgi:glycosyltransferase involved in cell wall biosynthesis